MTKTEYLFGYEKEKYNGVEFPQLAYERLTDANELLKHLYDTITYDPKYQDEYQYELRVRLTKIQDAIDTWGKILELED